MRPASIVFGLAAFFAACTGMHSTYEADRPVAVTPAATASVAADTVRSLGNDAHLWLGGLAESVAPAAPARTSGGRTFHVDSRHGDDARDGLAPRAGANPAGPWRTLSRIARSDLRAGDTVVLACGSRWNETLRLPASGRAGAPIIVRAAAGCSVDPPAVDGATRIAPSAWTSEGEGRWSAPLAARVLAVQSASRAWDEAHHPNRGHDASAPASPYLRLAATGDRSNLVVGNDLALPAGASLAAGARARVRVNAWLIEESPVAGFDGTRLRLAQPTSYPAEAGWGYLLLGQRWMLDSPGEWWHDAGSGRLWIYTGSTPPQEEVLASTLATAIDLQGRAFVAVEGLVLRHAGTGVDLRGSQDVALRNSRIEDMADHGVDAVDSTRALIESNLFARSGSDAVSGWRNPLTPARRLTVRDNLVRASGVLVAGGEVVHLPRRSYAAIVTGADAVVSGNTIVDAGYIGIRVEARSRVEDNVVSGACSVLDDCAGVYTLGAGNGSVMRGNVVVASRGAPLGKPAREPATQAQGLYLDEYASGVTVEDNTVVDADHGIHLHVASHNRLVGNRLYANRKSQIWLQATRNREHAEGDVVGNLVAGNQIAPVSRQAAGLWLDTAFASTAGFGSVDGNRYFDRANSPAVLVTSAARREAYPFAQWQRASHPELPAARDASGRSASGAGFAGYRVEGGSVVPGDASWNTWSAAAPNATLQREGCAAGRCWRYQAGGGASLVSSPNFTLRQGQWYRLSVDLAAEADGVPLTIVLRRGGGGRNGFELLADRSVPVSASRDWRRQVVLLRATAGVNANDPATGDLGARIDIEGLPTGRTLQIANLELVPVARDAAGAVSGAFVNAGGVERRWTCPFEDGPRAALCTRLRRLDDGRAVSWPLVVPPRGAVIVHGQDPALADTDGDGIADADDHCPATPPGAAVDARGCPLTLR